MDKEVERQIDLIRERCVSIKTKVVIRCLTYNHQDYIADTLKGFINQNTDFPFVAIVHDDASNDKTSSIIKCFAEEYPHIILPIYELENQYSKQNGSVGKVVNLACILTNADYIAMCEGDDFWIDSNKLQKQVDFLESHKEYGMCYTKVRRLKQETGCLIDEWGGPNTTFKQLLVKNTIPTPTTLFRMDLYRNYLKEIEPANKAWKMGDYPLWLYISLNSKILFLNEISAVYRILGSSGSHNKSLSKTLAFRKNFFSIGKFFIEYSKIVLSKKEKDDITKAKLFELIPIALVLDDKDVLKEARNFYKYNKKSIREFLLLNLSLLTKYCLLLKYKRNGYSIN